MSKITKGTCTCSKCNNIFEFTKYDSINESFDIDLKEKLLSGELNNIICPICHQQHEIRYPILYHKMGIRDIMIQFTNEENAEEVLHQLNSLSQFSSILQNPFMKAMKLALESEGEDSSDIIEVYSDWNKFLERIRNI